MRFGSKSQTIKAVRPEEFIKLMKAIPKKDKIAKVAFLLAYAAGMRISEVIKLKKQDFREDDIFLPWRKKGASSFVPIPKGWRKEYLQYLPLKTSDRTLQRKFKKYAAKAGISPHYVFHSLRHGFATRCVESGIPVNQLQQMMGHSNLATTNVYTQANPEDSKKSYLDKF